MKLKTSNVTKADPQFFESLLYPLTAINSVQENFMYFLIFKILPPKAKVMSQELFQRH